MDDTQIILDLQDKVRILEERLGAIEIEQRRIREDILSGRSKERMQKRILEKPPEKMEKIKERLDKKIKIKI
jgi:hypothetical protein